MTRMMRLVFHEMLTKAIKHGAIALHQIFAQRYAA
jgi:hypothetical protein